MTAMRTMMSRRYVLRTVRGLRGAFLRSLSAKILSGLFLFVLGTSGIFYFVESRPGTAGYTSYWEALEDILILAFSGFDVGKRPETVIGYAAALAVLVAGIVFVSIIMADAAALFVRRALSGDKGMQKMNLDGHILVCNWNEHGRAIVDQLVCDDVATDRDLVVVADLEEHPCAESGAMFISGSPARDDVLTRASIEKAHTAIVMGNGQGDVTTSDSLAILTALAVESRNPDVYSCVLIFDPENKRHLEHAHVDEIICVSELTDNILAHSALNHGLTSLISQLLVFGDGSEIYKVRLPDGMVGTPYLHAAKMLLDEHECLLIGVQTADGDGNPRVITVTHEGAVVQDGDCGFVVAEDMPSNLSCPD